MPIQTSVAEFRRFLDDQTFWGSHPDRLQYRDAQFQVGEECCTALPHDAPPDQPLTLLSGDVPAHPEFQENAPLEIVFNTWKRRSLLSLPKPQFLGPREDTGWLPFGPDSLSGIFWVYGTYAEIDGDVDDQGRDVGWYTGNEIPYVALVDICFDPEKDIYEVSAVHEYETGKFDDHCGIIHYRPLVVPAPPLLGPREDAGWLPFGPDSLCGIFWVYGTYAEIDADVDDQGRYVGQMTGNSIPYVALVEIYFDPEEDIYEVSSLHKYEYGTGKFYDDYSITHYRPLVVPAPPAGNG